MTEYNAEFNNSSVLESCEYNDNKEDLRVTFRSGTVWTYQKVPINVYRGLADADSPGKYFGEHVRGKFIGIKE